MAAQEAGLPLNFIDEFAHEVQSRRVEREHQKPSGARLDSASAATKRAKAAWEKARAKFQDAEALVASVADVLVNALKAEKVLRKQARTECTKEDSDCESKMAAAELHEVLAMRQCEEGVAARSPETDWASGSSVRSNSHANADGDKDKQQHAREAEAARFPSAGGSRA